MLAHSLFVLVALTGIALDWKSPPAKRKPFHGATPWRSWPHDRRDCLAGGGHCAIDSGALLWLAPVGCRWPWPFPWPSSPARSPWAGRCGAALLLIPEEAWSPRVAAGPGAMPKGWRSRGLAWHRSGHGLIQAVSEGQEHPFHAPLASLLLVVL